MKQLKGLIFTFIMMVALITFSRTVSAEDSVATDHGIPVVYVNVDVTKVRVRAAGNAQYKAKNKKLIIKILVR